MRLGWPDVGVLCAFRDSGYAFVGGLRLGRDRSATRLSRAAAHGWRLRHQQPHHAPYLWLRRGRQRPVSVRVTHRWLLPAIGAISHLLVSAGWRRSSTSLERHTDTPMAGASRGPRNSGATTTATATPA